MSKPIKTPDEAATERFNLIAPLIGDGLDKGIYSDMMGQISEQNGISERTLKRYLNAWEDGGYEALKPKQGWERSDKKLGGNFEEVVAAAIELRRESPSRSVADIIKILELEGTVQPGEVARSTLQRYLSARGYATSQMRMYTKKGAAARRFRKEHRNELWQSDIKYGPYIPAGNGKKKQIYLVVWLDDSTRYITGAKFYIDQTINSVEDCLRASIQKYGIPEKIYVDNGGQYRSEWLGKVCAKLGIRRLTARPFHPEGKGKVEIFNKNVGKFISEAALKKPANITEYNELLRLWLDEYYHKNPHSGLGGISPATAYGTDTRPLRFAPANQLRDAFLHTETRKVDKTGCVSFAGQLYEAGLAYIGQKVEIRFDVTWTDEIEIIHGNSKPFTAKKLVIGRNCGGTREIPEHMRPAAQARTSRMLDALEKKRESEYRPSEIMTSFKEFWEGDVPNV